jgi:hypothetical protein
MDSSDVWFILVAVLVVVLVAAGLYVSMVYGP